MLPTAVTNIDQSRFKLYPNPASSFLNIQHPFGASLSYKIYSLNRSKVQEGVLNNKETLYIGDLPSGSYLIKLNQKVQAIQSLFSKK